MTEKKKKVTEIPYPFMEKVKREYFSSFTVEELNFIK